MAFRDQHEHSLDSKDRLTIPARYRAQLAEGVVLLKSLDPCVGIYPPAAYARFSERYLAGLNPLSRQGRMIVRRFHAHSRDESLDAAGRLRLPRHLIEHAGLQRACVVVGADDHLEVWHPGRWREHEAEIEAQVGEMTKQLEAGWGA